MLWKGDREQILQLVNDLYSSGAQAVHAVEILKEGGKEVVAMFVVTLPGETAARKRVFQIHDDFWRKYLIDATPEDLMDFLAADFGQKYLLLNFDL